MNTYDIYYSKDTVFHDPPVRFVGELINTHAFVTIVYAVDNESAYLKMQAYNWRPSADDYEYLQKVNVRHASMSIDDVLHCRNTKMWFQVIDCGFRQVF